MLQTNPTSVQRPGNILFVPSKFRPSWWLSNPHLQTLWASKVRRGAKTDTKPERLELPDGDFLDVNWCLSLPANVDTREVGTGNKGIACIFHGLGGSIHSKYASHIIRHLANAGFDTVFMHFRGCSSEPNRLAGSYHSGHTIDIKYLIDLVRSRYPEKEVHAIGYSLGANALLKYLGEEGAECELQSAIAVSPPLVLQEGANRLNTGFSKIYQRYLLGIMKSQLEIKRQHYPKLPLPQDTGQWSNFWKFDDDVTAPLSGFENVNDYYTRCSSRAFLQQIKVPTHIIFAKDDPFFSAAVIPREDELAEQVAFELADQGGHVGFVHGTTPWSAEYWLDQRILELLKTAGR